MKPLSIILLTIWAALAIFGLCSCSTVGDYVQGEVGFYKPVPPADPDAEFGVFISRPSPSVTPEK